jgi:hypothetical protein
LLLQSCEGNSPDEKFISGAALQRQKIQEMLSGTASIVYRVPAMSEVQVRLDEEYEKDKFLDVYYPPGYDFNTQLPGVVVVNGLAGIKAKSMGRFMDWGLLLAAEGMIGITYDPVYADKDLSVLLDYLTANADELGIDKNRIGLLCYCETCCMGLRAMQMKDREFYQGLKAGAFLYGTMPWSDNISSDASILMVKTGKALDIRVKDSIEEFAETARNRGLTVEVYNHENGFKYFDITEKPLPMYEYGVNPAFTADCDAVKAVVRFLQTSLTMTSRPL